MGREETFGKEEGMEKAEKRDRMTYYKPHNSLMLFPTS